MADYLLLGCQYLDIDIDSILAFHVSDDELIVVVDKGIAGAPKYSVPLSRLSELVPVAVDLGADELPVPAAIDMNELSYRELQSLAKQYGIAANQSADDLLDAIRKADEE